MASKSVLMIDGATLNQYIFKKNSTEEKFFTIASTAPSVCVCRCSPHDKAYIVKMIAKYTK